MRKSKLTKALACLGIFSLLLVHTCVRGQADSTLTATQAFFDKVSTHDLKSIDGRYDKMQQKLASYCARSLNRLQKKEEAVLAKLSKVDSIGAKQLLEKGKQKYARLAQQVKDPLSKAGFNMKDYVPGLDSVQTVFRFLDKNSIKIPGLPTEKLQVLTAITGQLKSLQAQLHSATDIKEFMRDRNTQLQEQLNRYNMGGSLQQVNKQVYYYQQQVNEYKEMMNDPGKMAQKALSLVKDLPAFKTFMANNSQLAQLFNLSGGSGANGQPVPGLQTRAGVQQQASQGMGGGVGDPQQFIQQQTQAAEAEMNKLKDKLNKAGGGSADLAMPDFKPNNQKTKSFWKRVEYGINIQSQKTNSFLPVTSDIALTAGYKLNDKSVIGIGMGYKLGWGKNISNIHLTSQGISVRSFLDIKLKGSLWITGGYEENYQHEFTKIDQLKDMSAWQKSGLMGLTKKYKIGKKSGNLQLLWDFLSYSQVPQTTAFKFRVGYTF